MGSILPIIPCKNVKTKFPSLLDSSSLSELSSERPLCRPLEPELPFDLGGLYTSSKIVDGEIEIFEPEKTEINHIDSENEPEKKSTHTHKHGDQEHHDHNNEHHGDH
jgi:hypothetical protein